MELSDVRALQLPIHPILPCTLILESESSSSSLLSFQLVVGQLDAGRIFLGRGTAHEKIPLSDCL